MSIREITYSSREEWLELRKNYIGGSEAGAVLGLDEYNSPYTVWGEKTGRLPGFEGNITTRVGSFLEDLVATLFCEETGKQVRRKNRMLVNSKYPWACADVDRMVVGEDALLECKTTNSFPVMKSIRTGSFPDRWYCQMMHYLAVTGKKKAYLAVLVASRDFYWFELERDESEIEALMNSEQDFWWCVETDTAPDVDGSEATAEALETIYADGYGEGILMGRETLLFERSQLKAQQKETKKRIDEIENIIKADLGCAETGVCSGFKVTWKNQSRRSFQEAEFRKAHPEIDLTPFYKVSNSRVFKVKEAS